MNSDAHSNVERAVSIVALARFCGPQPFELVLLREASLASSVPQHNDETIRREEKQVGRFRTELHIAQ
jgi:hypothetical protein